MEVYHLKTEYRKRLADTQTPVSIFLKLRDKFANCILLESSDYHGSENSVSYICCHPIAGIEVSNGQINLNFPDGTSATKPASKETVIPALSEFAGSFQTEPIDLKFTSNGLFGYMGYNAVQYFEEVELKNPSEFEVPEIIYRVYRYVIAIDHFKNEMHLFEHRWDLDQPGKLGELIALIDNKNFSDYHFRPAGKEISNYHDDEFLEIISRGIQHCLRGDVFQIVLSRRFQTDYAGDDFNVYRALRSINPSPYLFYFDYGNFRVFGSSPEAQIVIKDGKAVIHPIAGTFARTGNDQADTELAQKLFNDTKENSEHVMLVDLARNDLSRNSEKVQVDTFKEIQYFSHVIHLVSKVSGELNGEVSPVVVVADTFPAGTLSGAPKHMAMTLIDRYENSDRGYYGGAIGFMGFDGEFNHAIMIRSFLSQHGTLYYQAGAGVVAKSIAESELQEVNNKLAALRQALKLASEI
ncbi:MAG: anthranilate synthase component I [Cyclobacteriaceae bacterium]|nr:MAG: anthranilate synthase component I [Cyclobacteriaceae bacterium]